MFDSKIERRSSHVMALVHAFRRDRRASIITIFAVAFPALAVAVTAVAELAEVETAKTELQASVDAAALKGAGEMQTDLSSATSERARLMADSLAAPVKKRWSVQTTVTSDFKGHALTVTQTASRGSLFGNLVPPGGFHLTETATAVANSTMPLCVLTTVSGGGQDLHLTASSNINALGCLVQSDSNMQADSAASLISGAAQSVGTATGTISPTALTDAPSLTDPFASLAISVPTTCSDQGITVNGGTAQTLAAGTHCGTIKVQDTSTLTLGAGEHYFLNCNLNMNSSAQLSGSDVVLIFSGSSQMQTQGPSTSLSFNGRQSGPYAGFVLMTDRSLTGTFNLNAANIPALHGTVYIPAATLAVNMTGSGSAAGNSPWTVIIANGLQVQGSTKLLINSNYLASNVPVPTGVGPGGGGVQLTR